jgi:hypothetical protein
MRTSLKKGALTALPIEVAYPSPAYGDSTEKALLEEPLTVTEKGILTDAPAKTFQQKIMLLPKKHYRRRTLMTSKKRRLMLLPKSFRQKSILLSKNNHRWRSLLLPKKCQLKIHQSKKLRLILNQRQWGRPMSILDLKPKTLTEMVLTLQRSQRIKLGKWS